MTYYVYMLRCEDGSLYVGLTTDPKRRLRQHSGEISGGAKYTALHRPLKYETVWSAPDKSSAFRLEYRLKRLNHAQKESAISCVPEGFSAVNPLNAEKQGERAKMLFVCYPKCSTCKKARELLDSRGIEYEERDIKQNNPTEEELRKWHRLSGLPLKRFFNTSGQLYVGMGLKDKLPDMTEDEQYKLLATDGMLVRRPVLVGENFVLVGFKTAEWEEKL